MICDGVCTSFVMIFIMMAPLSHFHVPFLLYRSESSLVFLSHLFYWNVIWISGPSMDGLIMSSTCSIVIGYGFPSYNGPSECD